MNQKKMKKNKYISKFLSIFVSLIVFTMSGCAQPPMKQAKVQSEAFNKKLNKLLSFSVPTVNVDELAKMDDVLILDARERKEYDVSHIPNAKFAGYKKFDKKNFKDLDKDQPIVIYCSVGYRSEKIGEKFIDMGFTNVSNLYGSIFEWVNQGHKIVDKDGNETKKVHCYNKKWSKWVDEDAATKIY